MKSLNNTSARARSRLIGIASVAALLLTVAVSHGAAAAGDADRGEALYQGCQDCHSLDKNDVGPRHRGVFGRKAGSIADYNYSDGLKQSGLVWDEASLDKWLSDPQAFIPGAKMFYHLSEAQDRADVIAFLKERAR
jgi:cytochrome c